MFRILTVLFGLCLGLTVFCLSPKVSSSEQHSPENNHALDINEVASTSLSLSTYLGGGGTDSIRDVATDILGNVYITGGTASSNFPVTVGSFDSSFNGVHDVFVAKIDPSGDLVWSTFIGGPNYDRAYAIEVDSLGFVYVAGRVGQGFPTTAGALQRTFAGDVVPNSIYGQQDGFIAKLSGDGSRLIWSTYFGSDGRDFIRDLDVDASGSVYVAVSDVTRPHPHVKSGAFQTTRRGPSDGMVAKLSSNGSSVVWGSYFGGSGDDGGTPSARVDATGNMYYLTHTTSTDAPVTAGAFKRTFSGGSGPDLMVARISSDGTQLVFSTYFGGTAPDFTETHGLAIDAAGNAYIGFTTKSTSLPTTVGAFQRTYGGSGGSSSGAGTNYPGDVFVAKISGDGSQLLAATYVGGRHGEGAEGISVDTHGNVYISGATYSDNFPVTSGAFQSSIAGDADLFAVKLTGDLRQLSVSTYIGGSDIDYARASTVDSNGSFYVAGHSNSSDWPVSNPIQSSYRGAVDGVLVKLNQTACQTALWPLSQSFPAAGGTGSVGVTAQTGCAWTGISNVAWISVTSGGSGTGNGTINYSVTLNTSTNSRTGTITVAGQTFTVAQAGTVNCSFSLAPNSQSFNSFGGTGTVQVSTQSGCSWTATSNAAWINVTSGGSGSGSGTVNYSVASNSSTSSRNGTVTIAGQTFSVTQAGTVTCSFSISPTSRSLNASGGTGSVQVSTQTGCSWTATSNAAWINVTSGSSGAGNGTVNYSVASNTSTNSRNGTVTIAGQTFSVTQAGTVTCSFSISPTSRSLNASGGTGSVQVSTQTGCSWTATGNAAWINVTSGSSGTGNGTVNYSVASNTSTNPRTGTVTIAGQTFSVTQAGTVTCSFSISPTSRSLNASGGTGSVQVSTQTGCSWTATSNVAWINVTSGSSGAGSGTVNYSVASNTSTNSRNGTVTIAGQTFSVTQAGTVTCSFSISPTSRSLNASGGTGSVEVSTQTGCSWTATGNAAWINVTSGSSGTGNGTVNYSVASNTSTNSRNGTVTIAGRTFSVTQAGTVTCSFSISPTSRSLNASGGTGSVEVSTQTGCTWTATSNAAWINVTSGSSGIGNGTVNYSVASNTSTNSRTGTVTIAGRTFSVTQAGTLVCSFSISPTSRSFNAIGGTGSVQVSAPSGCSWTTTSNASWIKVISGSSGTGSGTVNYSVASNTTANSRTGTITIAGLTFTVTEAAAVGVCGNIMNPTNSTFGVTGGEASVTVIAERGCTWTAVSNASWITIPLPRRRRGNATVWYSVAFNTSGEPRIGTMTIAGRTFTVNQP